MIMQINGPMAPPLPYLSTTSTSATLPAIHSADAAAAFHIPNMRRVLSSPSQDITRPRGPSDPYTNSRKRAQPHYITNNHAHEYVEDYIPSFLRDQQSTSTKQAIKQMAEHRVLLETNMTPLALSDEDDYAWYLKNPHRYVRRPRDRNMRMQRRKMVLYGEMVEERDDQTNRNLFAAYIIRHYGATLFWDGEEQPSRSRRNTVQSVTPFNKATNDSPTYWNTADASDEDGSTVFWIDEWEASSSPTLGDSSSRRPKLSGVSCDFDNLDLLRSASPDLPVIKTVLSTMHNEQDDSKKRRLSNLHHTPEGKRNSFFRTNSTRMRAGSHRRFSFLRIFST